MEYKFETVSVLLLLSLILNIYLWIKRTRQKPQTETQGARDLLADLFASSAVVEIKLLDKGSFFIRSPRG